MNPINDDETPNMSLSVDADLERLFKEAERSIDHIIQAKRGKDSSNGDEEDENGGDDVPEAPTGLLELLPESHGPEDGHHAEAVAQAELRIEEMTRQLDESDVRLETMQARYEHLEFEYRNYRERNERQKSQYASQARAELLQSLLDVLDTFEFARNAFSPDKGNQSIEHYQKGFQLLHRQVMDVLEKIGLQRVQAEGKEFDPEFHQAVAVVESDQLPPQTIVQEIKAGYLYQDFLLRPVMVKVTVPPKA